MVAIVGGGIGGIALAAALQHRGVPCAVYEKDSSFEERRQGYGLTMQQGARALRSLGFFSLSDDDGDDGGNEEEGSFDESGGGSSTTTPPGRATFGIHSTRHVVHKPCGTVVGEWGMRVWGGRRRRRRRKTGGDQAGAVAGATGLRRRRRNDVTSSGLWAGRSSGAVVSFRGAVIRIRSHLQGASFLRHGRADPALHVAFRARRYNPSRFILVR